MSKKNDRATEHRKPMHPMAIVLTVDHYEQAICIARARTPKGVDYTDTDSDAGLALCLIAQRWVEEGRHLEDNYPFGAWLAVKLPWVLMDMWRARNGKNETSARRIYRAEVSLDDVTSVGEPLIEQIGDNDTEFDKIDDALAAVDRVERLQQRFKNLTPKQRRALTLRAQGETLAEIGRRTGTSESAVCCLMRTVKDKIAA